MDADSKTPADRALARLRDPNHSATATLARLVARETRDRPLTDLVNVEAVAAHWATGLRQLAQGDRLEPWLERQITEALDAAPPETLEEALPFGQLGTIQLAKATVGHPFTVSEDLVFRIINQPALQALLGHVLSEAIRAVSRRLGGQTDGETTPPWRGLLRSVRDNLGGVAGQIVDAVREEVDGVLDGRMTAAIQHASERAVRSVARYLADPAHAQAFAEMRAAVVNEVLSTPVSQLADEARDPSLTPLIETWVATARRLAAQTDLDARIAEDLRSALTAASSARGHLGAWLDDLELGESYLDVAAALVEPTIRQMVTRDEFARFWTDLHA
ncbi:MAG: hypothetical protein AAGA48_07260 [Myxococcota bacterium]